MDKVKNVMNCIFLTTVGFTKGRGTIKSGGRAVCAGEPGDETCLSLFINYEKNRIQDSEHLTLSLPRVPYGTIRPTAF